MQDELKNQRDFAKVAFLLFCITLLYFFPVIFSSQTFASRDLYAFFYPRRLFAAEAIRNGILPLWNPHLASGVPFLANLQSSLFYPPSSIYYLLPFHIGFKYFIILHYYLSGLFMFLLMKHLRYETSSSITAAIVFMFGGYMISILDNVAFLTAAAWFPLIVLFFDRALQQQRSIDLVVTGVLIGLQILGGDASCYLLSTFFFMVAYLIYYLLSEKDLASKKRRVVIFYLPGAWIIGLGLSSVQLIPFLEFISHSTRTGGLDYETLTKWSYNPFELLQLLVPYVFGTSVPMCRWFGQYWLDTFYIGVLPLFFLIFCFFWSKDKRKLFLILILTFSLFMALGKYNPVFYWVTFVPGINMLHYPVKYLFLAGFVLSILAGMGFSSLFARIKQGNQNKGVFVFLLGINLIVLAVLIVGLLMDNTFFELFKKIYPQTLFHKIAGIETAYLAIFRGFALFVILFTGCSMFLAFTRKGLIPVNVAKVICISILLADLMFLGKPSDPIIDQSLYTESSETVKVLKKDQSRFRIFSLSYIPFEGFMHMPNTPFQKTFKALKTFLTPNLSLIFGIDTIDE
ncbi:MAG: YfhO family protein, partial [Thermodesulfobacteriota bacterium]|nr:YfhO family protein [Thermodesulfobacteriota bacterium]